MFLAGYQFGLVFFHCVKNWWLVLMVRKTSIIVLTGVFRLALGPFHLIFASTLLEHIVLRDKNTSHKSPVLE